MRKCHYLSYNSKTESPSYCVFFDTETEGIKINDKSSKQVLKFGIAHFTRKLKDDKWTAGDWLTFYTPTDLWEWIDSHTKNKSRLYVFAHNLIFDMTVSSGFAELPKLGYKLSNAIIDDPPTIIIYRKDNKSICLLDTFNWFHSSLKDLGKAIGRDKLSMPSQDANFMEWLTYCKGDVFIIRDAMLSYIKFIKTNDFGNFQPTLASQSFALFRHKFMQHRIFIDNNNKALDLSRKGYYGGRTEAFFIGKESGNYYLLDVNSMYPFVMANNKYPIKLRSVYSRVDIAEVSKLIQSYSLIADVNLNTDENCYPVTSKNGLLFPLGKFRTVLPTPELSYALCKGHVLSINKIAIFEQADIFTKYIDYMYNLRTKYKNDNNMVFSYLCKIVLNSLYGKFGQRGRVFESVEVITDDTVKNWIEYDVNTKQITKYRQFGGLIQRWQNEGESFNSFPAISAQVTSFARLWLWKLINIAGIDNVYYTDTDSLVVNKQGYDNIEPYYIGDELGCLKIEQRFTNLTIHGAKDYVFGDRTKIKGIRANAKVIDPNTFIQDKFSKFKSMLRIGDINSMIITQQQKHLNRIYTKGIVTESGRVKPFTLSD